MNESGDIVTDLAVVVDLFNAYAILLLVAGGFCLVRGGHWIQLLWPPLRERARETLHRRAARAMRVHAA